MDAEGSPSGFWHDALLYEEDDEFLAGTVPFVRDGVEGGEAVMVVVDEAKLDLLRGELDRDAEPVEFLDMREVGGNPARLIPLWLDFAAQHVAEGRPFRGIGEPVWAGRSPAELEECRRHESLLNVAFAQGSSWQLLCPYDASALDDDVLDAARHNHAGIVDRGARNDSEAFTGPGVAARRALEGELPEPPPEAYEVDFAIDDLPALRAIVGREADRSGLPGALAGDLVLAVSEVATNSVRHAGGQGQLRVWHDDTAVVCEVHDDGRIDEPLVGRSRPAPDRIDGHGLWLVNQLCDLVQIRSGDEGTVVRLRVGPARARATTAA
jgi:anti-sigma regulatory factor (Ser/Thr protein kinase)